MNKNEVLNDLENKKIGRYNLPQKFANDEDVILKGIEVYDGLFVQNIGNTLKNNKEFALKVLSKYGYCLQYFSNSIKNDFECCKASIVDGFSGYRYIGETLKDNKELALTEIHREYGHNIKEFSKKLRLDKEIIAEHWKKVYKNSLYFGPFCSVIGVDEFGNYIIDKFKNIEYKRHTPERIERYEEQTENIQFVKFEEINKKIFSKKLNPFLILIGKNKNNIAQNIINDYSGQENRGIHIIEVYESNIETENLKLITSDEEKIFNLLRIITYTTAGDTWLTEDNLWDIEALLLPNKDIEIKLLNEEKEQSFYNANVYIIQLAGNNKHTLAEYTKIVEKIQMEFGEKKSLTYHIHNSCNFDETEAYIWKLL